MTYQAPNLPKNKHAFFGRGGGVSTDEFSSLNVNQLSSDDPKNIQSNMEIIAATFQKEAEQINILNQTMHTNTAVYIEEPSQYKIIADGAVTKNKNIMLGITTADCTPVLFADYQNGIIGAAHSGWRGSVSGVLENTLDLMIKHGAKLENISAAIGPCIQQQSFEVGQDVFDKANAPEFFAKKEDGKYMFNLEGYIIARLQKYGLKSITASGLDTYSTPEKYFSYRRNTHRNIKPFPVQLSVIGL